MKEIKDYVIKLRGKASILQPLEVSHNYKITGDFNIQTETYDDNHDGTFNVYYSVEPVLLEILKDNGELIKGKDTRKMSQKVRNYLYKIWEANPEDGRDSETAYNDTMKYILSDVEFLYQQGKKK